MREIKVAYNEFEFMYHVFTVYAEMEDFIMSYARKNYDYIFEDANESGDEYRNDYNANEYIWEQLRCLVTSWLIMSGYEPDVAPSDNFMLNLYNEFKPTISFEQFENYMYKYVV